MTRALLGVLDWGVGGLGVVRALRERSVQTPIVYLSDTGAVPYGRLDAPALTRRVDRAIASLVELGASRVLIACNAASTVLDRLDHRVPVSGVIEPTLRDVDGLGVRTIGVIGGGRTIRSGAYRRGLATTGRTIIQRIAQPLSAHIEAGTFNSMQGHADLRRILAPLGAVDALVLACTHYPAIAPQIQAHVPAALLIDPALSVAKTLATTMSAAERVGAGGLRLLTTGEPAAMRSAALAAWGLDVVATSIERSTLSRPTR